MMQQNPVHNGYEDVWDEEGWEVKHKAQEANGRAMLVEMEQLRRENGDGEEGEEKRAWRT